MREKKYDLPGPVSNRHRYSHFEGSYVKIIQQQDTIMGKVERVTGKDLVLNPSLTHIIIGFDKDNKIITDVDSDCRDLHVPIEYIWNISRISEEEYRRTEELLKKRACKRMCDNEPPKIILP